MVAVQAAASAVDEAPQPSVQAMAGRVEALLAAFDSVSTPRQARDAADDLARTIVALYGEGLTRVLDIVYEAAGAGGDAILAQLAADPFVESLLCLHDLHPVPLADRVQAALDAVRPYLKSHEGGVDIAGIEGDVVVLRLEGSCDGCPSSAATVKLAVERAILERVPEIREVRALGVADAPASARVPTLKLESDWIALADLAGIAGAGDALATHAIGDTSVLFVRFADTLYAYRNACPTCRKPLADARLQPPLVGCASCGETFDAVHAGRATRANAPAAEPFPLARENGRVRVAIPLGA